MKHVQNKHNMKRIINILAAAVMIALAGSCKKEDSTPTANFQDKLLSLHPTQSVELVVTLDKAAPADMSVPVQFISDSKEFTVSADNFQFKAGETSSKITLTDVNLPNGTTITAKLSGTSQAYVGLGDACFITKDAAEDYSITVKNPSVEIAAGGKAALSIRLTGAYSGDKFMASEDMHLPLSLSGNGSDIISFEGGTAEIVVRKGSNEGKAVILAKNDIAEETTVTINIKTSLASSPEWKVKVIKACTPDMLDGTWVFSKTYDQEELEMWFEEMEDDPALLPLNNEGFTLTFSTDENGVTTLTPGEGDFAWFFRVAGVSLTEPVNVTSGGEIVGQYSCKEANMFQMEDTGADDGFIFTYFKLSSVNRDFSADSENLGEGVIALRINEDGDLELMFRDYDQPPFGEMWWDDEKFDPDMFGFCSLFTKAS